MTMAERTMYPSLRSCCLSVNYSSGDKIDAAVKGGCTLAAISIFEDVCVNSVSYETPALVMKVKSRRFYSFCLQTCNWLTGLSTKAEIVREEGVVYWAWHPYVDSDDEGERV